MKHIVLGISALLMLAGCSSKQVVVQPVEKKVEEKKVVNPVASSNSKVPPLPVPEVDVDMDSAVERATQEVLTGDTVAYK
ncbi:MAG: membrane lipoprotein lipid attachment site-containing protein [Campylobacterota bacterium]|nr:membrane lipoprotein lipid attachment site-containing protein [Campylobacterota bacterium]